MQAATTTVARRGRRTTKAAKELPYMSRDDIEVMIAEGRKIILVDDYVLKADAWLRYHPGGDTAILHMVGRDATDEVKAYDFRVWMS